MGLPDAQTHTLAAIEWCGAQGTMEGETRTHKTEKVQRLSKPAVGEAAALSA